MRRIFITGTDTEIGKTWVACALTRHLVSEHKRVAVMKPVAAGCESGPEGPRNEDALALMSAANVELPYATVNPVALRAAIAPHIAAEQEGRDILLDPLVRAAAGIHADFLIIEGAGGWCVPLGKNLMTSELVRAVADEVILVVGLRLGCLNHALLTAHQVLRDGCRLTGWVANSIEADMPVRDENLATLVTMMPAPLLASFTHGEEHARFADF